MATTSAERGTVAKAVGVQSLLPDAVSSPSAVRSTIKDFSVEGVTFECWSIDGSYAWLSTCGRLAVGRSGRAFWVRIEGRHASGSFPSLRVAMASAARTLKTRRAA